MKKDGYILTALFFIISIATCLSDLEYKACWNIDLTDENMFCYGAVHWMINTDLYYNA